MTAEVELKFNDPESSAEGRELREELSQKLNEINARLSAHNELRPNKGETRTYGRWYKRREELKTEKGDVLEYLRFVKRWLHDKKMEYDPDKGMPSRQFHGLAKMSVRFEHLYIAVGEFLANENDRTHDAMCIAYDAVKRNLGSFDDSGVN